MRSRGNELEDTASQMDTTRIGNLVLTGLGV